MTTAAATADAAAKAAGVGLQPTVGTVGSGLYTVFLQGDVAAVEAAVDAGLAEGRRVGTVVGSRVIARPAEGLLGIMGWPEDKPAEPEADASDTPSDSGEAPSGGRRRRGGSEGGEGG